MNGYQSKVREPKEHGLSLRALRHVALALCFVLVLAAISASFAESYRGLLIWAGHHGLVGSWAAIWPLQVDVFIAVGELLLVVAMTDGWTLRSQALP